MSTAEDIYQRLDALTGGIEDFLNAIADETYEVEVYEPFHRTVMGGLNAEIKYHVLRGRMIVAEHS